MTVELSRHAIELEILRGMIFDKPWWDREIVLNAIRDSALKPEAFFYPPFRALFEESQFRLVFPWEEVREQLLRQNDERFRDVICEVFVPPLLSPMYLADFITLLANGQY